MRITWKKAECYGYVYDFSVSYDATPVDNILDIYKWKVTLLKKILWNDVWIYLESACFNNGNFKL